MGQVRIGTCANPIDGAFIRTMFEARGIRAVIGAEHHASLLGPISGAFLTLDIWVDADDAEAASELLRDVRETKAEDAPDPRAAHEPDGDLDDLDDDGAWVARSHELANAAAQDEPEAADERRELDTMRMQAYLRRRAVAGMLLTFGTGLMFSGAPLSGMVVAAIEVLGLMNYGPAHGLVAIVGAVVANAAGTAWRLWGGKPRLL